MIENVAEKCLFWKLQLVAGFIVCVCGGGVCESIKQNVCLYLIDGSGLSNTGEETLLIYNRLERLEVTSLLLLF